MMLERLREALGFDVRALAGGWVSGEVPLTAELINGAIAARLAASRAPVAAVTVEPCAGDAFVARVRLRLAFVPTISVRADIVQQPRFPDSPVLTLRWAVAGLGPLARLASPALKLLGVLPRGIRVDGDGGAAIDLAEILRSHGDEELLPLLRELHVSTTEGRVVVRFGARV
jgi:hypothetical protein